jgi:hypothetical protein
MLNDIDFFSIDDLFDTSRPQYEDVDFALLVAGPLVAVFIFPSGRRNRPEP